MSKNKLGLIYDVSSVPDGWDLDNVIRLINEWGVAFYDSRNGNTPEVTDEDLEILDYNQWEDE